MPMDNDFKKELEQLINKYSIENESDTPDFILANYVQDCLYVFETATLARDKWYGNRQKMNELYAKNVIKNFVPKDSKYTNIPVEIINI